MSAIDLLNSGMSNVSGNSVAPSRTCHPQESKRSPGLPLSDDEILKIIEKGSQSPCHLSNNGHGESLDDAFVEGSSSVASEDNAEQNGPRNIESDDSGRASSGVTTVESSVATSPPPNERGVVGFNNLGNTCFINAGLQCLLNTPALVEFFGTRPYWSLKKRMQPKARLLRCFFWLFNKVWGSGVTTMNLGTFKNIFSECHCDFEGSGQHDSQEFLALLLDTVDDQLRNYSQKSEQNEVQLPDIMDVSEGPLNSNDSHNRNGSSAEAIISYAPKDVVPGHAEKLKGGFPLKLSSIVNQQNTGLEVVVNGSKRKFKPTTLPPLSADSKMVLRYPNFQSFQPRTARGVENSENSKVVTKLGIESYGFIGSSPQHPTRHPPNKKARLDQDLHVRRKLEFSFHDLKISDEDREAPTWKANEVRTNGSTESLPTKWKANEVQTNGSTESLPTKSSKLDENSERENLNCHAGTFQTEKPQTENSSVISDAFQGLLKSTVNCASCQNESAVTEPFMFFPLSIPRDVQRILKIHFVSVNEELYPDLRNRPTVFQIQASISESVLNIKHQIIQAHIKSRTMKLEDLVMAYVSNFIISGVIGDSVLVENIDDSRNVYLYEVNSNVLTDIRIRGSSGEIFNSSMEILDGEDTVICDDTFNQSGVENGLTGRGADSSFFVEGSAPKANADCSLCWDDSPPLPMHRNNNCGCSFCASCYRESVLHALKDGENFYKCPHCTQLVSIKSVAIYDPEAPSPPQLVSFVFVNVVGISYDVFGYPLLLRLPMKLCIESLTQFVGTILPLQVDTFSLLLLSSNLKGCGICSTSSTCPGCQLPDQGLISLPPGCVLGIRFENIPTNIIQHLTPEDMVFTTDDFSRNFTYNHTFGIYDCLREFAHAEKLDDEENPWFCIQCNSNQGAYKRLAISRTPQYLIIHLKRFLFEDNMSRKLENLVEFPLVGLNLTNFVSEDVTLVEDVKYDLYGCVCHSGGVSYGHYTAYVKNPLSSEWYYCNDAVVAKQDPDESIFSTAYVLFYAKSGTTLSPELNFVRYRYRPEGPSQVCNNSPQKPNLRPGLGLKRKKRPESLLNKSPRKPPLPDLVALKNEIMADFEVVEDGGSEAFHRSQVNGSQEDDDDCKHFIGRHDHLLGLS